MRRQSLVLLTLLPLGIGATAHAQVVAVPGPDTSQQRIVFEALSIRESPMTREHVVARLLSFDRDGNGRVTRSELPERMHDLLQRGDADNDSTLDDRELRELAATPTQRQTLVRGLQPGIYGFGDNVGFDSRLHIEGAIDDLRLAEANRAEALTIAKRLEADRNTRITSELLETMSQMLTEASLADFKGLVERNAVSVRAIENHSVAVNSANAQPNAVHSVIVTRLRTASFDQMLGRAIDKYGLQPAEQQRARAAVQQYTEQKNGRLSDADRQALLNELHHVLNDQQRDDLRAALERRPIVKQGSFVTVGQRLQPPAPATPAGQTPVVVRKLVFTP